MKKGMNISRRSFLKAAAFSAAALSSLALTGCGSDYVGTLLKESRYTLAARTVMPSVTLPCHMSLFHGVPPERHNVLTNTFIPPVRPIDGLCERLTAAGKQCAFFYDWAELRDLTRPDSLAYAQMFNRHRTENPDDKVAAAAESILRQEESAVCLPVAVKELDRM